MKPVVRIMVLINENVFAGNRIRRGRANAVVSYRTVLHYNVVYAKRRRSLFVVLLRQETRVRTSKRSKKKNGIIIIIIIFSLALNATRSPGRS